ncbi:hypothetical protein V8C37DRAFT_371060, partial [Trichoderma ceciliae]
MGLNMVQGERRKKEKCIQATRQLGNQGKSRVFPLRSIHARYQAQCQISCGLFYSHLLAISIARFPALGAQFPPISRTFRRAS